MGYYNIFELALIGAKSVKHALINLIDTYRPKILIRKPIPSYKPQPLFPSVAGMILVKYRRGKYGVHY